MDRARRKTDRILQELEGRISGVYASDPALLRIQKKYHKYMDEVEKRTKPLYDAFVNSDINDRNEALSAYKEAVKALTLQNKQYKAIISQITTILARVNQEALDLINSEMTEIYTLNYNQIAVDCRKAGITVDGKPE